MSNYQKYLTLGLADTDVNRKVAEAKARLIESDISLERFDYTLEKYGKQRSPAQLTVVESIKPSAIRITELWDAFFSHKRSSLKAKTIEKYENFSKLYAKLGDLSIDDALAVKQKLESVTTTSRTKDALMYLSAACKWGMKHKLVNENPYLGMSQEMPQHRYMTDPQPNAFTEEERDRIITAFKTDKRKGMNYRPYAPFVEFLFLCGCRPSEAVGLRWKHLAKDCGTINFEESLVQVRNRRVHSEGSKNNRTRSLAISPRLQALFLSIKPEKLNPEALVATHLLPCWRVEGILKLQN